MLYEHEAHTRVRCEVAQKLAERLQPAGRRSYADDWECSCRKWVRFFARLAHDRIGRSCPPGLKHSHPTGEPYAYS